MNDSSNVLTSALEAALVRELANHWKHANDSYFRGALRLPLILLSDTEHRLGRWIPHERTIEISRKLVVSTPWGVTVEVLKHEMAHQFVHEVMHETAETAHGPHFQSVCERLGIDGRASGTPVANSNESDRIADRIARLLALAESANVHEAEAAMAAARRLLLKHNVELSQRRAPLGHGWKHLGRPSGRITEAERILSVILGEHFFVEAIWIPVYRPLEGKRGSVLEICGTEQNLQIAEYVHGYLTSTAERLWNEHKNETATRSNRDRRTFLAGVMTGMNDKLTRENKKSQKEGLVWVKDADVVRFFRRRHPYVRHIRHAGEQRNEAYARGRDLGRSIVIHKGVSSAAENRGRLLPAKRS